jgi:hypothetical protein
LPSHLANEYPDKVSDLASGIQACENIKSRIQNIVHDVFCAYENEYTIFAPMSNCFEVYGLDFMVDADMNVSLLEVNPGPDFKQTGERLRSVIIDLFRDTAEIVLKNATQTNHFIQVYSQEWSLAAQSVGMKFN